MNKRIIELAKQAGYEEDMFGIGHWDMLECRKFVELIVKECADKIEHDYKYATGTDIKWNTAFSIACDLKEHFGVE